MRALFLFTGVKLPAWRAHKRYTNTITKMFSVNPIGTEYIPFDSLD